MQKKEKLAFTDQGEGFPVILLHGFCETHMVWKDVSQELCRKYRVLCPDLPGFGKSDAIPTGFSIDDVADHVYNWLQTLSISNCIIIGHSLGGYVTLALVDRYPSLFAGFGLFHSTAFDDDPVKKASRNKVIDFVNRHGPRYFAESFIPSLFFQYEKQGLSKVVKEVVEVAADTSLAAMTDYTLAMRDRPNRIPLLEKTKKPVLFVAGEKDTSVPLEKSKAQACIPLHHHVFFLDNTGHMGMFESPNKTVEIIGDFVAQYSGNEKNS